MTTPYRTIDAETGPDGRNREGPTVLQVVPELEAGGAELSAIEVSEAVVAAGGQAIVASEGGRLVQRLLACGARHIALPVASKSPFQLVLNARRIAGLIRSEAIDIVHARSRAPAWSALFAARRTGAVFVTTYHGIYNEHGMLKKAYNRVMARGERVIANSNYTASVVRQRYGVPEAVLRVVNRGVAVDVFDPARMSFERTATLLGAWGVEARQASGDGRRPVILHPARLTRWKGQLVVIEAAQRVLALWPSGPRPLFILAGDPQGRDGFVGELEASIAARGLGNDVKLVGHVDDMPAALSASACVLIASIEPEAFGRTAAEAQAMGVPVIATNIGAPRETVLSRETVGEAAFTGWHVPPNDPAALAEAITGCLALTRPQRDALAVRARAHAVENFSTSQLQARTLAVYDELLGTDLAYRFALSRKVAPHRLIP